MDFRVSRRFFNLGVNMFRNVNFERWLVEITSGTSPLAGESLHLRRVPVAGQNTHASVVVSVANGPPSVAL